MPYTVFMTGQTMTLLVVGATGSIGRLVVDEAVRKGYRVRALARDPKKARRLLPGVEVLGGDLALPETLPAAVEGVGTIIFTHGSDGGSKAEAERVDYGGVRNVLAALGGRSVRISLMTSIGVTNRTGDFNRRTEIHDWKRRGERLLRASGLPYTIVRPGWFDYNQPDERHLVFLQGDRRHAGDPTDGVIARGQIAEVLVASLGSDAALRKTFEMVATHGEAQQGLDAEFDRLDADAEGALDAVRDLPNMPATEEPERVRRDLETVSQRP